MGTERKSRNVRHESVIRGEADLSRHRRKTVVDPQPTCRAAVPEARSFQWDVQIAAVNHDRPCEPRDNLVGKAASYSLVTCADVASHRPFRRAQVSV